MIFSVIAYAAFGILCVWFIISGVRKINEVKKSQSLSDLYTDEKEHDEAIKKAASYELDYFERVRKGEQTQQFLAVGDMTSSSMIRSLLCAENIPTFAENEHINSMYSLNHLAASSAFSIKIFILVADYDRAYQIVSDFIAKCERAPEKQDETSENAAGNISSTVKKVAAAVTTGFFFIPMPDGSEEKTMGISILPKIEG